MNALFLFSATFCLVLFLGLQSLNVNGGHRLLAALKGRSIPSAPVATQAPAAEAELSIEAMERIDANRHFVHDHMPEAIPFIRALHSEGLIEGWRAVIYCKLI